MCFSNMCNAEFWELFWGEGLCCFSQKWRNRIIAPSMLASSLLLFLLFLWGIVYLYRARCSYILALAEASLSFLPVCCHADHCVRRWWISVFRGKWTSCCILFCFLFFVFISRYFKTPDVVSYFIFKVKALKGLAHPDILLHIWFIVLFSFPSVPQIFIKWMDIRVMVFR